MGLNSVRHVREEKKGGGGDTKRERGGVDGRKWISCVAGMQNVLCSNCTIKQVMAQNVCAKCRNMLKVDVMVKMRKYSYTMLKGRNIHKLFTCVQQHGCRYCRNTMLKFCSAKNAVLICVVGYYCRGFTILFLFSSPLAA